MKIKRRTLEKTRNWILIALVVLLLGFFYRLYIEKDWFTINSYLVTGVSETEKEEIVTRLKSVLSHSGFFLFPGDKILSYSHADLVKEISEIIPSRKNIVIRPSSLKTLSITLEEFTPVMKLSDTVGITKEGVIFPTKRTLESVPLFESASSTTSFKENGFVFARLSNLDENYLENLVSFSEKVSATIFLVTKVAIDELGDVRLYGQGGRSEIVFTTTTDLNKGWSTLLSAIDTDPLKTSLLNEREKLAYIDLRFGNKVFYKFGNDEFQNGSSTVIIDDHASPTATTTISE